MGENKMFRDKEYEVVQMEENTENSEMIVNGEVFESVGFYQISGEIIEESC